MTMTIRPHRWLLPLGLALVLAAASTSCGSTSDRHASTSSPAPRASTTSDNPVSPSGAMSRRDLRIAVSGLLHRNSGHFTVTPSSPSDASNPLLLRSQGAWNIKDRAGTTVSTSVNPSGGGDLRLTTVLVKGDGYVQALFAGSSMAPDCWIPSPGGSGQGLRLPSAIAATLDARSESVGGTPSTTMPLTDVLGAIGFQKAASSLGASALRDRVPVLPRVESGLLRGWRVDASLLRRYFTEIARTQGLDENAIASALNGARWEVSFSDIGRPVRVDRPAEDKLLGPGRPKCSER